MLTLAIILTTASITTYGVIVIVRDARFERALQKMREEVVRGDVIQLHPEAKARGGLKAGGRGDKAAPAQRIARHSHHDGKAFSR